MPTYDFRCPQGHEFERFYRKISDAPSTAECPECHAQAERRVSGGAGLLFKGSGFYITDYGKDGKKDQRTTAKPEGGESKSEAKAEGAAPGKAETKSEGSTAAKPSEPKKSGE